MKTFHRTGFLWGDGVILGPRVITPAPPKDLPSIYIKFMIKVLVHWGVLNLTWIIDFNVSLLKQKVTIETSFSTHVWPKRRSVSIWPMGNGAKWRRGKYGIPLIQPMLQSLIHSWYMPFIQTCLKIQPLNQNQVEGFYPWINHNCYWHLSWSTTVRHHLDWMTSNNLVVTRLRKKCDAILNSSRYLRFLPDFEDRYFRIS